MDFYSKLTVLDWFGASVEVVLALVILFKISVTRIKLSLFSYAIVSGLWQVYLPVSPYDTAVSSWAFLSIEGLRYLTWLLALLYLFADLYECDLDDVVIDTDSFHKHVVNQDKRKKFDIS